MNRRVAFSLLWLLMVIGSSSTAHAETHSVHVASEEFAKEIRPHLGTVRRVIGVGVLEIEFSDRIETVLVESIARSDDVRSALEDKSFWLPEEDAKTFLDRSRLAIDLWSVLLSNDRLVRVRPIERMSKHGNVCSVATVQIDKAGYVHMMNFPDLALVFGAALPERGSERVYGKFPDGTAVRNRNWGLFQHAKVAGAGIWSAEWKNWTKRVVPVLLSRRLSPASGNSVLVAGYCEVDDDAQAAKILGISGTMASLLEQRVELGRPKTIEELRALAREEIVQGLVRTGIFPKGTPPTSERVIILATD